MPDVLALLLLVLDVLLLALLVTWALRLLVRAVARLRRRRRTLPSEIRRCDQCRLAWRGEREVDYGRTELLLKRRARRRARARAREAPEWARARGWSRCPSCLSTRVRTSGSGEPVEEQPTRLSLEAVGYVLSGLGAALLVVAVVGLALRG